MQNNIYVAAPASAPQKRSKGKRAIIIVVIVLAILSAIGITVFLVFQHQEDMRKPHDVKIQLEVPDWQAGDTLVPVKVFGRDFENNHIDDLQFIDPTNPKLSLPKGSYTISFPASPLTVEGRLYSVPSGSYDLNLPEDLGTAETVDLRNTFKVDLQMLNAIEESEEMIETAYEFAQKDTDNTLDIETLKEKALQVYQDAVAQKEASTQKARIAAEREARVDHLSGTYLGFGSDAQSDAIRNITISDDEIIIEGPLFSSNGGTMDTSQGDKRWVFKVNADTKYGYNDLNGAHYIEKSQAVENWKSSFPQLTIVLDNGMVKSIMTSS